MRARPASPRRRSAAQWSGAATIAIGVAIITTCGESLRAQSPEAPAAAVVAKKATEAEKIPGKDWVRLQYDDHKQLIGMQTAIVRYVLPTTAAGAAPAVTVDLIGAVHVGDAAYYADLNRRFTQYDALLYELVAPAGTEVPFGRGTSNSNPLGAMQNGMKTMLGLEHQLEKVDYTKKNFVHADMSPDEFLQSMKERNEGFLQIYMRLLGASIAQQSEMAANGESADVELLTALFSEDRPRRLKMVMAKQLSQTESLLVNFNGEGGSVLISERNKTALKVLKEQLAAGKKKLGIFYGAGHLSDMDHRLRQDFGMEPVEITWLTAWDLQPKP